MLNDAGGFVNPRDEVLNYARRPASDTCFPHGEIYGFFFDVEIISSWAQDLGPR